jgi:hypothetical protein
MRPRGTPSARASGWPSSSGPRLSLGEGSLIHRSRG